MGNDQSKSPRAGTPAAVNNKGSSSQTSNNTHTTYSSNNSEDRYGMTSNASTSISRPYPFESGTSSSSRQDNSGHFQWLDGRPFLDASTKSPYILPSDTPEQDRLLTQHYILQTVFKGNVLPPVHDRIPAEGKILDVGCGQGIWLFEVANEFPECTCVGVDIAAVFPKEIKPKNVSFHQINVIEGLPFADNTFDFVAQRMMNLAYRSYEWPKVIAEIMRVTKPGGYIQIMDIHNIILRVDVATQDFNTKARQMMMLREIDPDTITKLKRPLTEAGFVDIERSYYSVPIGWSGPVGDMMGDNTRDFLLSLKPLYIKVTGISETEYLENVEAAKKEWVTYKSYCNYYAYTARKPEDLF